ncbi:MAG TPA: OsmC family peroxiredoxin [Gaiellaceae bacterium]|nr:OsmC family peroxiredoxin [Gaiellaceae bacterium]
MPRIVREADIDWEGTTARGSGVVRAVSTKSFELSATIAARVDVIEGKTSPEELLAAAHATCFVASLGSELARLGAPPEHMHVRCTITMDEVEGAGHRIVASDISASAVVPGADAETFATAARAADEGCTFSALIRASATVNIQAVLEEGRS